MDKLIFKNDICILCLNQHSITVRDEKFPCPVCRYGNFVSYGADRDLKKQGIMCLDCSMPTHKGQPRCYKCHLEWKEQESLCQECGKNHHKNKYVRCFICNFKKKIS